MHFLVIALAALKALHGVVVAIHGPDVVIDLGSDTGLPPKSRVELFRSVEVKHPRTGRRIRDEFFLSTQDVLLLGARLSIVRPPPDVVKELKVGDSVSVDVPDDEAAKEAVVSEGAKPPAVGSTPGRSQSPAVGCGDAEARIQRARAEGLRKGMELARAEVVQKSQPPPLDVRHDPPRVFLRHTHAQLVFAVSSAPELRAGWLYYRSAP